MKRRLVAAAVAWPIVLGLAAAARAAGNRPLWSDVIYLAASRVCHQRPDRSFFTAGVQWPVCGRCAGLYLAAPIGAVAALLTRRRARHETWAPWLAAAAVPTALSLVLEWAVRWPVTSAWRFAAALPLGATIAFVLVRVAPVRAQPADTLSS